MPKKLGRPKLSVDDRRVVVAIRVSPAEQEAYMRVKPKNQPWGQWVREVLNKAAGVKEE